MKKIYKSGWVLALLLMVLVIGCEQVSDPMTASKFQVAQNVSLYTGMDPQPRTDFYHYENILFSMKDLYPNQQTDIQIIRINNNQTIRRLMVITEPDGEINMLPIWNYINYEYRRPSDPRIESSGELALHLTQPGDPNKIYTYRFVIHDEPTPFAQIRVVDVAGNFVAASVLTGNPVYVAGHNLPRHTAVKMLVVDDRTSYASGDTYTDVTGVAEDVMVDADGVIEPTVIWSNAVQGAYDVIADTAPYGVVNAGDLINEIPLTGLIVQNPPSNNHLVQDIACNQSGVYQNSFESFDAVYAKVNSNTRPQRASEFVNIYILPHRDVWTDGDALISLPTVGDMDMPIMYAWNGAAGSLPLTLIHGGAQVDDPVPPRMFPCQYDVVLDMNRDYTYNRGYDILDGGPQVGFSVAGDVPAVRMIGSCDLDILGRRNDEIHPNLWGYWRDSKMTRVWATLLDDNCMPISGVQVTYNIVSGPGTLSGTVAVTDGNGMASVDFTSAEWGKTTVIRMTAIVNGVTYTADVNINLTIPYTHNQGIISNIGGFNGF